MTAPLPALSVIEAVAEKVPGTMPSLVPRLIEPEFEKKTVVPSEVAGILGPTYTSRFPLVT
jgi:hypothetical protein